MKIRKFIQDQILLPRLKKNGVLVVYDPDARYRDLCLEMEKWGMGTPFTFQDWQERRGKQHACRLMGDVMLRA